MDWTSFKSQPSFADHLLHVKSNPFHINISNVAHYIEYADGARLGCAG